jgi:hypothetical protein
MSKFLARLEQEPAAFVGLLSAFVAVLVGFGWGLTSTTGALVLAGVQAVLGVYLARKVKETLFAAITSAAQVLLTVAVGFGAPISDLQAVTLVGFTTAVAGFLLRAQFNPEAGSPTNTGRTITV